MSARPVLALAVLALLLCAAVAKEEDTDVISLPSGTSWVPYGPGHASPEITRTDRVCYVWGQVKLARAGESPSKAPQIAQLPEKCQPHKPLFFSVSNGRKAAKVRVDPNGDVLWVGGGQEKEYLALNGMAFGTEVSPIMLADNWAIHDDYQKPSYEKADGFCRLTGYARMVNGGHAKDTPVICTLPAMCRPNQAKRVVYHAMTGDPNNPARIDIFGDGQVRWVDGGDYEYVSLDGIAFPLMAGTALALSNSNGNRWANYDKTQYEEASYLRVEKTCVLSGVIRKTGEHIDQVPKVITTLPLECRPAQVYTFQVNGDRPTSDVGILEVHPTGEVVERIGEKKWFSLDGVVFPVDLDQGPEEAKAVPYRLTPIYHNKESYAPAVAVSQPRRHVCVLEGTSEVKDGLLLRSNPYLGSVPKECKPPAHNVYVMATGPQVGHAIVYVLANRQITWKSGGHADDKRVSFANAAVLTEADDRLQLTHPWRNHGHGFMPATYAVKGKLCYVEGLINTPLKYVSDQPTFTYLPKDCRPSGGRLIIPGANVNGVMRIDVHQNGQVWRVSGSNLTPWVSLSNVFFPLSMENLLQPAPGWHQYGSGYQPLSYSTDKKICTLAGLIKHENNIPVNMIVATLPEDCRPSKKITASVIWCDGTATMGIYPDGQIRFEGPRRHYEHHTWISLSGIQFGIDCSGMKCLHGGAVNLNSCTCGCEQPWAGDLCEVCDLSISGQGCMNNGLLDERKCECQCVGHWRGRRCDENMCDLRCRNNGQYNHEKCSCTCKDPWVGRDCSQCSIFSCKNDAELDMQRCACNCRGYWGGSDCGTCGLKASDCKNGGRLDTSKCVCKCARGWFGPDCSDRNCSLNCKNGGVVDLNTCQCKCEPPWAGKDCSLCGFKCANGGVQNKYNCQCSCPRPWSGRECKDCTRTCKGGGLLVENTCTCRCKDERTGEVCEGTKRQCANNGRLDSNYKCKCPDPWSGSNCETCSIKCKNKGIAVMANCTCKCPGNWKGSRCEECKLQCKNQSFYDETACQCRCAPPWTGTQCDKCEIQCFNGGKLNKDLCKCECNAPWSGDSCHVCDLTCTNGGLLDHDSCTCTCPVGWKGDRCDVCDRTCLNGGTLTETCICSCPIPFSGSKCNTCALSCQNGGTPDYNTCSCKCIGLWQGVYCDVCPIKRIDCQSEGGFFFESECLCHHFPPKAKAPDPMEQPMLTEARHGTEAWVAPHESDAGDPTTDGAPPSKLPHLSITTDIRSLLRSEEGGDSK